MEEALTALLATVAGGQRYWVRAPQKVLRPYVLLNRVTGFRDYTNSGASGYVESRVQIDVYADTYTQTKKIARDIIRIMSGYRSGAIRGIFLDQERDLPASDAGEVTSLFRTSLDFIIHHTEN
ncbi:DUF3168 domain-containing protein [Rhizobium sp. LC145]|uniref:tail completion protein gp17 n=1 Tax=Rhizobium sp. LC145 TaxID=1120688 RepID=UPI00062A3424|nr:DUF3168 domain-containing protein [Rhizobium sp. LC145]KKX28228.1 hypothetical protein YH62_19260 [Rhizobium sp. LC145]TKT58352.1 DUF3168 domain-containing protein [Rhizobiaceae bacterium LC148]